jgi:hypothetical protein
MLVRVRNAWDLNDAFHVTDRRLSETIEERVLRAMLEAHFAHTDRSICIDQSRYWAEFLEMAGPARGWPGAQKDHRDRARSTRRARLFRAVVWKDVCARLVAMHPRSGIVGAQIVGAQKGGTT